jgi:hypothetical protein
MKYLKKSVSACGNPAKFIYEVGDPNAEVATLESLGLDMTKPEDFLLAHNNGELLTEEARAAHISEFKNGRPPKNFQAEMVGISRAAAIEMDEENPKKKEMGDGYLNSISTWGMKSGWIGEDTDTKYVDTKTKLGDLKLDLCKKIAEGYVEKFINQLDKKNSTETGEIKTEFINILAKNIQSHFRDRLFKRDAYGETDQLGLFWKDKAIVEGIQEGVKSAIIFGGYTVTPHLSEEQIEELKERQKNRKSKEVAENKEFVQEFSKRVKQTLPNTKVILN